MEKMSEKELKDHEIKVLVMPCPKNSVPGYFPDFIGFDITKKLEVYALGNAFIMTFDIRCDPSSQNENSFVHGELLNVLMDKANLTLEDDFTEYKYHFVPQESDGNLVIANVKERYNSQTPVYKELLNNLRHYIDEYYGTISNI